MKSFLERFEREDLPNEGLRCLSDVIGINNVKAIMVKMPGQTVHVPKDFYRQADINYIKNNMDMPVVEMARNLGCSVRTIYRRLDSLRS